MITFLVLSSKTICSPAIISLWSPIYETTQILRRVNSVLDHPSTSAFAIDQVILKNGSIVEGKVLSDVPNRHVDIQLVIQLVFQADLSLLPAHG